MRAEASGDGVGIAGGGDHESPCGERGFRDQSAKTPGSSVMNQTRILLPFPLQALQFRRADG